MTPLRRPQELTDIFEETLAQYDGQEIHPYLESSFFLPNPRWAASLAAEIQRRGLQVSWRCETRVDAMKPETVASLAAAGLRVIDLGLETASESQIIAMNKAADPSRYLRAASDLVTACAENGVWVKANVLLYAGETEATFHQTRAWLDDHSRFLKGVSVGPVVGYGPPGHVAPFLDEVAARGARPVDPGSANETGITHLHLSDDFDADAAEATSLALSRRYMTTEDYFDLKSFSYYPRGYSRRDFDADLAASDISKLPFRSDEVKLSQ